MDIRRLATIVVGGFLTCSFTQAAADAICPIDECNPNWEAGCHDVCTVTSVAGKKTRLCDIDDNDETAPPYDDDLPAMAYAIYDDSMPDVDFCNEGPYCAWGYTTSGTQFYCEWGTEGDSLVAVHLKGGAAGDYLSFICEEPDNPPDDVYMQEWAGYDLGDTFVGQITGLTGDDKIVGSRRDSSDYQDRVYAGNGADSIATLEGPDYIEGGGHADKICAGPGDDGILAGNGANTVCAQSGADSLVSGTGDDTLLAGGGVDTFSAGLGTDTCDDAGESAISCENSHSETDCEAGDTGAPIECPD